MNLNLDETIKRAKELGSYFITISTLDKLKEENNLNHFVFRKEFPISDIIPSLDVSVRSMGITLNKPEDVIVPPVNHDKKNPLRIAIFSHGATMPDSWSIGKAIRNQIKILVEHGHQVVYYTQEKSKLTNEEIGCEVRHLVPSFRREKGIVNEEAKQRMIKMLKEQLTSNFDLAISHDFFLQDTVTYREGIKDCNVPIPWLHFCRSGVAEYINWDMPNARYAYLNKFDAVNFAKHIGVDISKVRFIPNEKDPKFLFKWDPITSMIVYRFRLWEKDIIQSTAFCSTRLDAKGFDDIVRVFVELKRLGKKVMLIVCNSNGRRRVDELKRKCQMVKDMGLNEDEFCFTSLLANDEYNIQSQVPNEVVINLMRISNLHVFASRAEVCSNLILEAAMNKNLIVLNSDLPSLYDFFDKQDVLSYPFSSLQSLHYSGKDSNSLSILAKQIIEQLENNKVDISFRKIWRNHNADTIYYKILEPILYEKLDN